MINMKYLCGFLNSPVIFKYFMKVDLDSSFEKGKSLKRYSLLSDKYLADIVFLKLASFLSLFLISRFDAMADFSFK